MLAYPAFLHSKFQSKIKEEKIMVEMLCKDVVMHFNKKHLEDPTIPMWVVKTSGKAFYVNHVTVLIPWSTKETPDNAATKGSIKFKKSILRIDDDNNATISEATAEELSQLKHKDGSLFRILWGEYTDPHIREFIKDQKLSHAPFKMITGGCGSRFWMCDILNAEDVMTLKLGLESKYAWRELLPNEYQFKLYDDDKARKKHNAYDY